MFLADEVDEKTVLTVYCKTAGYTMVEAAAVAAENLKTYRPKHNYKLIYMGLIDFADVDQEIIERHDEFFEKHAPIWISSCSYT